MKIKTLPIRPKDYEASGGTRVENTSGFKELRRNLPIETFCELLDDNRKRFPEILGKMGCQWTGYVRWDIWKIEISPKTSLFLLTSKNGSSLEVDGDYQKDSEKINEMLKHISLELKKQSLRQQTRAPIPG